MDICLKWKCHGQRKIQIKVYIRFAKTGNKNEQMFVLVWTNEGQYGIINPDSVHNFAVHTEEFFGGFSQVIRRSSQFPYGSENWIQ